MPGQPSAGGGQPQGSPDQKVEVRQAIQKVGVPTFMQTVGIPVLLECSALVTPGGPQHQVLQSVLQMLAKAFGGGQPGAMPAGAQQGQGGGVPPALLQKANQLRQAKRGAAPPFPSSADDED
jgi:hypothetical protein